MVEGGETVGGGGGIAVILEKERCDSLEKLETLETDTETERVTGVCFVLAFYDLLLDFGERIPGNLLVFVLLIQMYGSFRI